MRIHILAKRKTRLLKAAQSSSGAIRLRVRREQSVAQSLGPIVQQAGKRTRLVRFVFGDQGEDCAKPLRQSRMKEPIHLLARHVLTRP